MLLHFSLTFSPKPPLFHPFISHVVSLCNTLNNRPDMVGKIILKTYLISPFPSQKIVVSQLLWCVWLCVCVLQYPLCVSSKNIIPFIALRLSHECNKTDLMWFICCSLGTTMGRRSTWRWDPVCVWPADDWTDGALSLQLLQERRDAQCRGHDLLDQLC